MFVMLVGKKEYGALRLDVDFFKTESRAGEFEFCQKQQV